MSRMLMRVSSLVACLQMRSQLFGSCVCIVACIAYVVHWQGCTRMCSRSCTDPVSLLPLCCRFSMSSEPPSSEPDTLSTMKAQLRCCCSFWEWQVSCARRDSLDCWSIRMTLPHPDLTSEMPHCISMAEPPKPGQAQQPLTASGMFWNYLSVSAGCWGQADNNNTFHLCKPDSLDSAAKSLGVCMPVSLAP